MHLNFFLLSRLEMRTRLKVFICLILSIIFFLLFPGVSLAFPYQDLTSENVFYDYIHEAYERSIVSGYSDNTFRPDNPISRGEMAKMITQAFDLETPPDNFQNFQDVDNANKFFDFIKTLKFNSIVDGFEDGTFRSDQFISRAEASKIVVKATRENKSTAFSKFPKYQIFSDTPLDNVFAEFINKLASIQLEDQSRIVIGYSDQRFMPENALTRAAMAKIIVQTISYTENGGAYKPLKKYQEIEKEPVNPVSFAKDINLIASYDIDGRDISDTKRYTISEDNDSKYREVWTVLNPLINDELLPLFDELQFYSDGIGKTLASVYRAGNKLEKFNVALDIDEVFADGLLSKDTLKYAITHEIGHVLTLNQTQMDIDYTLLSNSTHSDFESHRQESAKNCQNYYSIDGCSLDDSFLNLFYRQFWANGTYEELSEIYADSTTENELSDKLSEFYDNHTNEFVSSYAVTNPEEDIAETFAYLFFYPLPVEADSIFEQKLVFLNNLSEIRAYIESTQLYFERE